MLTIRKDQVEAFFVPVNEDFRKWVYVHLYKFFPEQCDFIGNRATVEVIEHGIERAKCYGILHQAHVCTYIDLMFIFGRDFDVDPKLPWATSILNDASILSAKSRIDLLYDKSMLFLRSIADK